MKVKTLLIFVIFGIVAVGFLSYPANAETGTITVNQDTVYSNYSKSDDFGGAVPKNQNLSNFTQFAFNITNWKRINNFSFYGHTNLVYAHVSEASRFTIISGGVGGGTAWYSSPLDQVGFEFDAGNTYTNGYVNISFDNNILRNISNAPGHPFNYATTGIIFPNTTEPVALMNVSDSSMLVGFITPTEYILFSSGVNTFTSNSYVVTYPVSGKFLINITKTDKPTKDFVTSQTTNYVSEATFNQGNFQFYGNYLDGLYLNVSLSGGGFNKVLINSSGSSIPPGGAGTNPVNITKPSTGGIVGFDKASYFVGDNVNISWYFSDDTWNNFNGKRLYLLLNGNPISDSIGCGSIDCIDISTQSGYYIFQATQLGTLQAILREGIFFYSDVLGGSASVQILPPSNSWIALNQTIAFAKTPVNVTYHIGYSVASYPAAVIEIDTIDIATGNTVDTVFPTVFPDGVINIGVIHPLPKGNYSIKLYDAVKNVYLDTKYLTMIVPNVQIPGQGITVSNISTDKTLYFYNDWMTVNFAVDDTNFSNYNYTLMMHVIALDRAGIVTKMIISPMQDQVGTFTTLVNIDKNTKCEQKLNCWFETGNNSINIVLMNSTASVTIAYANFTVSSTTVDGYGLQLSTTTPQSNIQFTITTTVPTLHTGRLRIVTTGSGNISAIPDQTVNAGISTLPATISIVNNFDKAYYNVELYGDDGILKVRIPITVTQQVKPLTTSEINAMDKIDSWTALFGLGVNPTSKFMFGMMITLLIAACGVILVKNDRFIGAALFGAIPFLFFSYISYFPIVVPVIVGIIIALKFRFL